MSASAAKTTSVLAEGDIAPAIALPAADGSLFDSAELIGKQHLVVFFYPKDDTPGCTLEANAFNAHLAAFAKAGTVVIGISKDSTTSHDKFACKYNLKLPLLSDESGDVCERYGVWIEKNMYGKKYMGIQRATFLIKSDGILAAIWPKVKPEGHAEEVLQAVLAL